MTAWVLVCSVWYMSCGTKQWKEGSSKGQVVGREEGGGGGEGGGGWYYQGGSINNIMHYNNGISILFLVIRCQQHFHCHHLN